MTTAGAVLTGGGSRRMGRTKALVEVGGVPMARRVADTLAAAGCVPVQLYGGDPRELASLDLPIVADRRPGDGPLAGVVEALRSSPGDVLVVACDLPALTADVLTMLLDAGAGRPDADAVVAVTDRVEPGCALWRRSALPVAIEALETGERALHRLLERLDRVEVAVPAGALRNVNTPDDLW